MLGRERTALMGVLNVTPDSFSDGGCFDGVDRAVAHGLSLVEAGADLVDVGGESTRPGAAPVDPAEEARRVLPVVQALAARGVLVSVDTRRPMVAREACRKGAVLVNDIGGLTDPDMLSVVAEFGVSVCVMHMQGTPQTMQHAPTYGSVVDEVGDFLAFAVGRAEALGIPRDRVCVDPGLGFGKTLAHNAALLVAGHDLASRTGCAVLIGASRKSFLGLLTGRPVEARDPASVAAAVCAAMSGATIIRAHDVAAHRDALRVLDGVRSVAGS